MSAATFDRALFERGLVLISTLLLQMGMQLEESGSAEAAAGEDTIGHFVRDLNDEDLASLAAMANVLEQISWTGLLQVCMLQALRRDLERKLGQG